MSKNKYMLNVLEWVLQNLNGDSGDVIPEPEDELEKRLHDCVDEFFIKFTKEFKGYSESSRYVYCKIYAFYNARNGWYCDAYIWEKEANSYFPQITVGAYCLAREFMRMLEGYRDGRI